MKNIDKIKILIIGGYGKVGKAITFSLLKYDKFKLTIAGRNTKKLEKIKNKYEKKISVIKFDITDINSYQIIKKYNAVISCIDQDNTEFVKTCLINKIDYFDVTASYDLLKSMKKFDKTAEKNNVKAVLGLGLCPGLTNLIAKKIILENSEIDEIRTAVLLGLGEKHGSAAIKWMIRNCLIDFIVKEKNKDITVKSFEDPIQFNFPYPIGKRKCYRFNIADQFMIYETSKLSSVSTRICFDSRFITYILHLMKKTGFLNLLNNKKGINFLTKVFSNVNPGSDIYSVCVYGLKNKKVINAVALKGHEEAEITGKTAAAAIRLFYEKKIKPGIHYIDEVFSLKEIIDFINNDVEIYFSLIDKN